MPRLLLEVIVQTVVDAREAAAGGADRLEVVRAIHDGGLTPSIALVRAIAAETSLPLRVMVRENAGYSTAAGELTALQRAAGELAALGVDGIVLGFAHDGRLSMDAMRCVLEPTPDLRVTFHRAFDTLHAPLDAIDELAAIAQIDRILTSGGRASTAERCERLRAYGARAGARFTIVAGGGVDAEALAHFARMECVREAHVGRAAREDHDPAGSVSAACVKRLRALAV